jgi:hypothetical protein
MNHRRFFQISTIAGIALCSNQALAGQFRLINYDREIWLAAEKLSNKQLRTIGPSIKRSKKHTSRPTTASGINRNQPHSGASQGSPVPSR